ncbi:hypothetical protein SLS62_007438 [Diatrype stigma]|uniref:Peptidase M43 pregnancy-associated plasma-A domain-containing protein n=1 Tax=Diatrype stigma TaxID=117547 RepID=A0AAN9YND2_9PEZI
MKVLITALGLTSYGFTVALANKGYEVPTRRGCQVSGDGTEISTIYSRQQTSAVPSNITVDVNFHIASTEADETLITDDIVAAQFDILHEVYSRHNITLVLNSTERVVDNLTGSAFLIKEGDSWVYHEEEHDAYLKNTRKGGYDALNLYFFSSYSPGATGYCQFPTVTAPGEDLFYSDSCQISAETMPGMPADRAFDDWNQGHIAVHETGHWFGLNHTFAGGCGATGDFVADTPAQGTEVYGCPADSDTCPDSPGLDPIHNFMGYTDDSW